MRKHGDAKVIRILVAAVLFLALALGSASACFAATVIPKPGTFSLAFTDVTITESDGVDTSNAPATQLTASHIDFNFGSLSYPGAYARAKVTFKNTGTLDATLTNIKDFISLSESSEEPNPIVARAEELEKVGSVLKAGESADFNLLVYWDAAWQPEGDTNSIEALKTIEVDLTYGNSETIIVPDKDKGGDKPRPPKTGDSAPSLWIYISILVISCIGLLFCLILLFAKRKKRRYA
ncbi:MAG: hypothetical protein LBS74_10885 [Oscillospiraceae bacterium]|nr:hypothetical protein [Oscillospiraceae bacterium]